MCQQVWPWSWQLALATQMLEHKTLAQQTTRIIRDATQLMLHGLLALAQGCLGLRIELASGGSSGLLATEQILFARLGARLWSLIGLRSLLAVLFARRGGCLGLALALRLRTGFFRRCSRRVPLGLVAVLGLRLGGPTRSRFVLARFPLLRVTLSGWLRWRPPLPLA